MDIYVIHTLVRQARSNAYFYARLCQAMLMHEYVVITKLGPLHDGKDQQRRNAWETD